METCFAFQSHWFPPPGDVRRYRTKISPLTMNAMDPEELRSTYRFVLNPPLFERIASLLFRDRIDPMARDALRATLAVLDSMTPTERQYPNVVGESHVDRIASGSGESNRTVRSVIRILNRPPRGRDR